MEPLFLRYNPKDSVQYWVSKTLGLQKIYFSTRRNFKISKKPIFQITKKNQNKIKWIEKVYLIRDMMLPKKNLN